MGRQLALSDFWFLAFAARWTILLSLIAFLGGAFVGGLLTLLRLSRRRALRGLAIGYVQLFQSTPLLMQLFLIFFGLSLVGFQLPAIVAAAIALILNSSAFLSEIWRGCIQAIPRSQWDGSESLGLSYLQQLRYVIGPQALRIAVPPTTGFSVQIVKETSLTSIIGFVELSRSAQLLNNATFEPLPIYGALAAIYFAMCFALSLLSRRLEAPRRAAVA